MSGAVDERRRARYATTKKVDRPASPLWTKAQLAKSNDLGLHIATGHGIRLAVERGHLIVEDGVADERRRVRFNRATSRLKRLVVIGHSGSVSLDALRWITDVGAVFVQVDHDSNLVTMSAPARHHDPKLRRAQALATDSETGRQIMIDLLSTKLERQATLCDRIEEITGIIGQSEIIRREKTKLDSLATTKELRHREATAAQAYWRAWAKVPVTFSGADAAGVPDHWRIVGPRTSQLDGQWSRRAISPVHAMLNYLYAILEVEATIACHSVGLDPSIGILHADERYRASMAADLMEPLRTHADEVVLTFIARRSLHTGDWAETADGTCRLLEALARELSGYAPAFLASALQWGQGVAATLRARPGGLTVSEEHPQSRASAPALGDPLHDRPTWDAVVLPRLRGMAPKEISDITGISLTSVKEIRSGKTYPRLSNRRMLRDLIERRANPSPGVHTLGFL
ncbi:MAG: CRISPR-associated endonuclease Cas1 [Microcella sp.]|uniref:CRISPR-associated endonuclease Cas1 n=1 Tax=Microcella sp. TaxID=1913979 RepID=UPI0032FCEE70